MQESLSSHPVDHTGADAAIAGETLFSAAQTTELLAKLVEDVRESRPKLSLVHPDEFGDADEVSTHAEPALPAVVDEILTSESHTAPNPDAWPWLQKETLELLHSTAVEEVSVVTPNCEVACTASDETSASAGASVPASKSVSASAMAPRSIGSGRLTSARLTWKPGDPFAGSSKGSSATRFRWDVMLTTACITASCGLGCIWVLRTILV